MVLIICPECNKEISNKAESCPHCGYPIEKKLDPIFYTYNGKTYIISELLYYIKINDNETAIKKVGESIDGSIYFSEAKKIVEDIRTTRKYYEIPLERIPFKPIKSTCPKCGLSDFEMVTRKWSPLTGLLTNKVERICRNCKARF